MIIVCKFTIAVAKLSIVANYSWCAMTAMAGRPITVQTVQSYGLTSFVRLPVPEVVNNSKLLQRHFLDSGEEFRNQKQTLTIYKQLTLIEQEKHQNSTIVPSDYKSFILCR